MEHLFTVHTKLIQDKTYYFVKKIMTLPEFKGLADVVVGYGMHTDFEKACSIAGIDDGATRELLLLDLEKSKLSPLPDIQVNNPQKNIQKRAIEIPEIVNRSLAERGMEVLN